MAEGCVGYEVGRRWNEEGVITIHIGESLHKSRGGEARSWSQMKWAKTEDGVGGIDIAILNKEEGKFDGSAVS